MDDSVNRRQPSRRTVGTTSNATSASRPRRQPFTDEYKPGTKAVIRRGSVSIPLFVDFVHVEMASLIRYQKHFNLDAPPNPTKRELTQVCMKHFVQHPRLRDAEVISEFLFANQRYKRSLGRLQLN